jgi:hypothetical protein
LFFWNKAGFLQDMASVRPSSATQGFCFLLNEYKALVCYICLSQSKQSPITTRGKIHHLIGSGVGCSIHMQSCQWSGRQSLLIFDMQVKSFFLQLNCAIRLFVAWLSSLPSLYELLFCHFFFPQSMKMVALRTQLKPFCKSDKLQKTTTEIWLFLLQSDWDWILECGNHTSCTNEKLLLTSHLFIKEGWLFVCFVCHIEISQSMLSMLSPPRSWYDLKSPRLVGCIEVVS